MKFKALFQFSRDSNKLGTPRGSPAWTIITIINNLKFQSALASSRRHWRSPGRPRGTRDIQDHETSTLGNACVRVGLYYVWAGTLCKRKCKCVWLCTICAIQTAREVTARRHGAVAQFLEAHLAHFDLAQLLGLLHLRKGSGRGRGRDAAHERL